MTTSVTLPRAATAADQGARYREVRDLTEALADPLSPADQAIQSMPDVSPTKWHRAHTTWFFETFLLGEYEPGYEVFEEKFAYLFNSYYEAVGERHPRHERGLLSRPSAADITYYRQYVDDAMQSFIRDLGDARPEIVDLIELGLHHEQQHQELLLMDIKHVFGKNPIEPTYRSAAAPSVEASRPLGWVDFERGVRSIGAGDGGFCFDNELPRHERIVEAFSLADRLVTCGEWSAFVDDGGYERAEFWLSEGWATVQAEGWHAPLYWRRDGDAWRLHTLHGTRPVDPAEPVVHVSHFEADAFASWAGARLPTEVEWEVASATVDAPGGHDLARAYLHPTVADDTAGLRQMFGELWQWTSSAYLGYPGFTPTAGAVGEYNGKFMSNQTVLRGGCRATPAGHVRRSYRNFFPSHSRWMFSGVRLAKDAT